MARLRANTVLASSLGTFLPGEEFDIDDEATASSWVAAGVVDEVAGGHVAEDATGAASESATMPRPRRTRPPRRVSGG